ncbi:MAG: tRNA (adenosine(37)-N6)-threonylcarbamoyltransferase complex dimerization subunit type 1 TsaB [Candidatus Omnitrophica bacterium]|nr:tRNA (adenosine(37)-N6)-threonylcarbamoyltransferase complex dimerization subunit type 1 TsaB [Candidatus Omnitrophota bacterium]
MKILAIDTATKYLSLGIYDGDKTYEYNLEVGPKLSSLLALTIKRTLEAIGLGIGDLDYFACGLGPGSFTGMRVGLSTMKGLSWAAAKPLIGISTLDILAMNALAYGNKMIIPVIDARRNLIYSCFYKNQNNLPKKISPYLLVTKGELFKKLKQPAAIFGDALILYKEDILKSMPAATLLDKDAWYPKAHNIIQLALLRIKNKKFDDLLKINPIYIYPKECQIKNAHK